MFSIWLRGGLYNGIRHENLMELSFDDELFDTIISFDVLEHVYDYKQAISEVYRCLRKGGIFFFSVPFRFMQYEDEIRTEYINDKNVYVLDPEYHGNPMSSKGSLVYTVPGWCMLDYMRDIGYSDSYAHLYFSLAKGHLGYSNGYPQFLFVGIK